MTNRILTLDIWPVLVSVVGCLLLCLLEDDWGFRTGIILWYFGLWIGFFIGKYFTKKL